MAPISENLAWIDFRSFSNHFWVTVILGEVPKDDELNKVTHWNASLVGDSADLLFVGFRDPEYEVWASHYHMRSVITVGVHPNVFTNTGYLWYYYGKNEMYWRAVLHCL